MVRGSDLGSVCIFSAATSSASDSIFRFLMYVGAFWDSWAP